MFVRTCIGQEILTFVFFSKIRFFSKWAIFIPNRPIIGRFEIKNSHFEKNSDFGEKDKIWEDLFS